MSSNWLNLLKKQNKQNNKVNKKKKIIKSNNKSNLNSKKNITRIPLTQIAKDKIKLNEEKNDEFIEKINSKTLNLSDRQKDIGKYLAIDCEFVGVGPNGIQSELARVSIVNFHGYLIYDKYVKPRERVTDWRTFVSGIRPADMINGIPFDQAQHEVSNLLKDRILVGHAVHHDLEALYLTHPKSSIRDTANHLPFKKKYSKGKTPSLKKLSAEILGWNIQSGEHSSVEDARATMLIYKSDKKNFDERIRSNHYYNNNN